MSLNKKKLLRALLCSLLVIAMVVVTGVSVLAEDEPDGAVAEATSEASSKFEQLPKDASLGERFAYGLKVAGIGMSVVFLVLIILMAVLYIFKAVALAKQKKAAPAAAPAPVSAPAAKAGAEDEETVVAVATAAIAAARGQSECAFKVISITKIQ